ncbi:MAG: alpha/beta fold hydrolase [Novosphingobium sp.]|nr:alpha/beta fold hydrolase [Novosphingobium sp.]
MSRVTPYVPHIPEAILTDLQRRLENVRWAPEVGNADWRYGVNGDYLKDLAAYWRDHFDWRAQEAEINRFDHFRTEIDGVPIHFIRQAGEGPAPIPLILSHGWPWTFWDLRHVIGPLSRPEEFGGDPRDAFDVIVPSLPGFGFSGPPGEAGMNFWRNADLWHRLMTEVLGYPRYGAQGGDWGALVTTQLGHKYADSLIGIHLTNALPLDKFNSERNWDLNANAVLPDAPEARAAAIARQRKFASHVAVHVIDPQTLAWMAQDSPVGLLAWLLERRRAWSDCGGDIESRFTRDELLVNATIYWATETFASSVRYYADTANYPWSPSHDRSPVVETPTGISFMVPDSGPGPSDAHRAYYNLVYSREHHSGGHFAPAEEPQKIVEDIRATFRPLRD